jgi:hypothetical protein
VKCRVAFEVSQELVWSWVLQEVAGLLVLQQGQLEKWKAGKQRALGLFEP